MVCIHAESDPLHLLMVTEEEKRTTPFDEIFAFDRTVSRLLEMQSQDYLSVQYSEWIQRRGSSKNLLTSLLQTESQSSSLSSSLSTNSNSSSIVDASNTILIEDEVFVPLFQINELSHEILSTLIQEHLTKMPTLTILATILKKTIEQMTGNLLLHIFILFYFVILFYLIFRNSS